MRSPVPDGEGPRSLVDSAEEALRRWLATAWHRPGTRVPPEHELAAMLGVSRGTLRTALQRLESTGEIVRRQGSGTFVGHLGTHAALREGLERLESYSSLARRRNLTLAVRKLSIEARGVGAEVAAVFDVEVGAHALHVKRVLLIDDKPAAVMADCVHPLIELPPTDRLRTKLQAGKMVLDVLIEAGVPIGYSSTRIRAAALSPRDAEGRALGVRQVVAALDLEETVHVASGGAVLRSRDIFVGGGLDLHVIRWLDPDSVAPIERVPRPSADELSADPARGLGGAQAVEADDAGDVGPR